jgi:signal transduction histidine kinase
MLSSFRKPRRINFFSGSEGAMGSKEVYSGVYESGPFLELLPFPAALWSHDRRACVFNHNTRRLLGLAESDFSPTNFLFQWTDRIHPQDREKFEMAWRRIENGEKNSSCRYRFFSKREDTQIPMQEFLFSSSTLTQPSQSVWSLYFEDHSTGEDVMERSHVRDLIEGLTHEIGNSLQGIRGEVDLLKLAGTLPQDSASAIFRGVEHICALAGEANEYLLPFSRERRWEDTASVIHEVVQSRRRQLAQRGIDVSAVFDGPLPKLPLGSQFRDAFARVIEFSSALLPQGGALKVEVGPKRIDDSLYVELRVINASPTHLGVEENDVFRPYLKVNDCRVGLTLAIAREILRRHFGKIIFHKEQRNRGVFSILIKVPMDTVIQ